MVATIVVLILIAAAIAVSLFQSVRIVGQGTVAVIERFGRYTRTLTPGLRILMPVVDRVRAIIDVREQVVPFPPQPVITQDNLTVSIDTVIYFQVTDARAAVYQITNYIQAIEQLTVTTLRNIVGGMDLERTLTSRDYINNELRGVLDQVTGNWGIRVSRVELKAVEPPASIQDSMEKQMRADRDRRAAILSAEGFKQSQILTAEGEKQAAVLRAEGEAKARALQAEGEAAAIRKVFDAIHEGNADNQVMAYQYLQQLPKIAEGDSNKLWIIPSEFGKALENVGGALGRFGGTPACRASPRRSRWPPTATRSDRPRTPNRRGRRRARTGRRASAGRRVRRTTSSSTRTRTRRGLRISGRGRSPDRPLPYALLCRDARPGPPRLGGHRHREQRRAGGSDRGEAVAEQEDGQDGTGQRFQQRRDGAGARRRLAQAGEVAAVGDGGRHQAEGEQQPDRVRCRRESGAGGESGCAHQRQAAECEAVAGHHHLVEGGHRILADEADRREPGGAGDRAAGPGGEVRGRDAVRGLADQQRQAHDRQRDGPRHASIQTPASGRLLEGHDQHGSGADGHQSGQAYVGQRHRGEVAGLEARRQSTDGRDTQPRLASSGTCAAGRGGEENEQRAADQEPVTGHGDGGQVGVQRQQASGEAAGAPEHAGEY